MHVERKRNLYAVLEMSAAHAHTELVLLFRVRWANLLYCLTPRVQLARIATCLALLSYLLDLALFAVLSPWPPKQTRTQ